MAAACHAVAAAATYYVAFAGNNLPDFKIVNIAAHFNDFTNETAVANDRMGIAVGSNPGNPFRAFADGSSVLGWDADFNNYYEYPGTGATSTRWRETVQNQLDFQDLNGDGRYQYLVEPGELLIYALQTRMATASPIVSIRRREQGSTRSRCTRTCGSAMASSSRFRRTAAT